MLLALLASIAMIGCPQEDDDSAGDDDTQDDDGGDDDGGDDDAGDDDTGDDDGGDDDGGDDDTGDDDTGPSGPATLRNSPEPCYKPSYLYPGEQEVGHWSAAALTPVAWPFTAETIRYRLEVGVNKDVWCKPNLAHRARVYIGDVTGPPADGKVVAEWSIPAIKDALGVRTVEENLAPALVLQSGEVLYVAVEMVGTYPEVGCVELCFDDPWAAQDNWWSNAVAPPFTWATLSSFGVDGNISIEVDGEY